MPRTFITGDYHGGIDGAKLRPQMFTQGQALTREDFVLICGDFGMPWTGSNDETAQLDWLEAQPWTTLFVDGNHECFPYLDDLPQETWHGGRVQRLDRWPHIVRLGRGQVFELPCGQADGQAGTCSAARVFTMGGATSVDRAWRVAGESWFAEELPAPAEYAQARSNLARVNWQVDYVVSHTCATGLLPRALYPDAGWQHPDPDELTDFFAELECGGGGQSLEHAACGREEGREHPPLAYRRWYFGHFHRDRDIDERHTLLYQQVVPLGADLAQGRQ